MAQGGNVRWSGRALQEVAPAAEGTGWAKSTDMATTIRATLHADGFKAPYSSGKDVSVLIEMNFYLDKKTALIWIDILAFAYRETGREGGWRGAR